MNEKYKNNIWYEGITVAGLEIFDSDIENLQKAIDDKNSEQIVKFSHYIKGACSSLAMNEASLILENIEKKALNGEVNFDLADLKSIFKEIQNSL